VGVGVYGVGRCVGLSMCGFGFLWGLVLWGLWVCCSRGFVFVCCVCWWGWVCLVIFGFGFLVYAGWWVLVVGVYWVGVSALGSLGFGMWVVVLGCVLLLGVLSFVLGVGWVGGFDVFSWWWGIFLLGLLGSLGGLFGVFDISSWVLFGVFIVVGVGFLGFGWVCIGVGFGCGGLGVILVVLSSFGGVLGLLGCELVWVLCSSGWGVVCGAVFLVDDFWCFLFRVDFIRGYFFGFPLG